jgi:hypothetical protein
LLYQKRNSAYLQYKKYKGILEVPGDRRHWLFGKIWEIVKQERLLQTMCFQSEMLEYFIKDGPLQHYTL